MNAVRVRQLYKMFADKFEARLPSNVEIHNFDKSVTDLDKCESGVNEDGGFDVAILLSSKYYDKKIADIDGVDLVEPFVDLAHEAYHIMQYMNIGAAKDKFLESESCVSRFYNENAYAYEYDNFTFEIAAERYALHQVFNFVMVNCTESERSEMLGCMRLYVNTMSEERMNVHRYKYFIDAKKSDSLKIIFDKFDSAYEKSLLHIKHFDKYPDDCAGSMIDNSYAKELMTNAANGRIEARNIAYIVLRQYPALCDEYPVANIVKDRISNKFKDPILNDLKELKNVSFRSDVYDIFDASDDNDDIDLHI